MISEPLEAILAILLITISLATAITYSKVITKQETSSQRVVARGLASVIADLYLRDFVIYGNSSYSDFRKKVGEICRLFWNRTGVWTNVTMYMIFLDGTEIEFHINSTSDQKPEGDTVVIKLPLMPRSSDENITWYFLSYRDYYYVDSVTQNNLTLWWVENQIYYFVAYTRDGLPVQGGHAQVTVHAGSEIRSEGADMINGISKIEVGGLAGTGSVPSSLHVFAEYTDPNGDRTTKEVWIDLETGDTSGRDENQMIVNETMQECHHFYAGETIYRRSVNRMNLTNIRESITGISLPMTLDDLILAQGPYNASIINGFDTSTKANVPFFLFPYTVRLEVVVVVPRG